MAQELHIEPGFRDALVKAQLAALPAQAAEPLKIAIMGCAVNGPGEAKEADIGIAGGDGKGVLFKKGTVVKTFPQEKLVDVLLDEITGMENEKKER